MDCWYGYQHDDAEREGNRRGAGFIGGASVLTVGLEPLYDVPCGGCTACCHKDAVRLLPGDDSFEYETEPHPFMPGELMLAHKPNGDCLYLGDKGCTIHEWKPQMCREMDCRRIAQAITWTQARKLDTRGGLKMIVWKRGKELLRMGSNAKVSGAGTASAGLPG